MHMTSKILPIPILTGTTTWAKEFKELRSTEALTWIPPFCSDGIVGRIWKKHTQNRTLHHNPDNSYHVYCKHLTQKLAAEFRTERSLLLLSL